MNLSEFLRRTALEKSHEIIRKGNSIILSNEDRDAFLYALKSPQEPNKKLKQALKYHKRLIWNNQEELREPELQTKLAKT